MPGDPIPKGILVLALVLVLSACMQTPPPDAAGTPRQADPTFSVDTGAIAGVVVDDSLQPVFEAQVTLDGAETRTTDAEGRFGFGDLAVGKHELLVAAYGFLDTTLMIETPPGQLTSVRVMMFERDRGEPYHETKTVAGFVACGVGTRDRSNNTTFANLCGVFFVVGLDQYDRSGLDWLVGPKDDEKVGFWAETSWRPSQPLGKGMVVTWAVQNLPWNGATARGEADKYKRVDIASVKGDSPLSLRIPIEALHAKVPSTNDPVCPAAKDCFLRSFHYPYADAPTATSTWAALYVNQRFDDYVTTFVRGELPPSFSILPDR